MRILVAFCVLAFAACHSSHTVGIIDPTIGGSCGTDRDCTDRCYLGGDFPGGFCSVPCLTDQDCPADTVCISEAGGVCLFTCPAFDCAKLGAGWACHDKDRAGGGNANVCSG